MSDDKKTDDENDLFRRMMADVKPLATDKRVEPKKPRFSPHRRTPTVEDETHSTFFATEHVSQVAPEESLFFARTGLQQRVLRQLKRGDLPIEANLDLHGQTIEEAGATLTRFLDEAQAVGCRCVIVVHGKGHRSTEGKPVLKSQVNYWLRESPAVLAFSSAQPQHGGTGALYVLLRKSN